MKSGDEEQRETHFDAEHDQVVEGGNPPHSLVEESSVSSAGEEPSQRNPNLLSWNIAGSKNPRLEEMHQ
jgi:hypothetical protein